MKYIALIVLAFAIPLPKVRNDILEVGTTSKMVNYEYSDADDFEEDHVPLTSISTDLFKVNISIGDPPQLVPVLFSWHSHVMYLTNGTGKPPHPDNLTYYDPSNSTTFDCSMPTNFSLNSMNISGWMCEDQFMFGNISTIYTNQTLQFGLVDDVDLFDFVGIFGLAPAPFNESDLPGKNGTLIDLLGGSFVMWSNQSQFLDPRNPGLAPYNITFTFGNGTEPQDKSDLCEKDWAVSIEAGNYSLNFTQFNNVTNSTVGPIMVQFMPLADVFVVWQPAAWIITNATNAKNNSGGILVVNCNETMPNITFKILKHDPTPLDDDVLEDDPETIDIVLTRDDYVWTPPYSNGSCVLNLKDTWDENQTMIVLGQRFLSTHCFSYNSVNNSIGIATAKIVN
ncbi:eukaryotic aspartyl protease domain-containing protein [Ditylenchus destructor]|nr:eukaryotic aspartyl protease domain-containing protein [Ditylenchus destructor]